jgi:hypothetical protein
LGVTYRKLKNKSVYSALQKDGVHFHKAVYVTMIGKLREEIQRREGSVW